MRNFCQSRAVGHNWKRNYQKGQEEFIKQPLDVEEESVGKSKSQMSSSDEKSNK